MTKKNVVLLVCLFGFAPGFAGADEDCIEVLAGFDGANPQSNEAIQREAADRFRVQPFNEAGSNDAYYFRFNTKVVNHCQDTREVELVIEWPALDEHPDYPYDIYYYGEKGRWRWTYAHIEGTNAYLRVPVPPGDTYVGFYPRYNYEQYLAFVDSLNASSGILKKWEEGRSLQGRKIYAVKITDEAKGERVPILITGRNHPYETGGSYILEEMIRFLSGPEESVGLLRKEFAFYFVPMMNPDGVALGMNQRTGENGVNLSYGVGTDDPTLTTLLSLVKRIRPVLWADIHSWPHKGDDGMWSTHKWVSEGLLSRIPDGSFQDYVWNVSFVRERGTAENHLWQWLIREFDSGGVSLSISWYRRNEAELREIAVELVKALAHTASTRPR